MYTESDLQAVLGQRKRRWVALLIPVGLLAATLAVSVALRMQWLSIAATIAGGVLLIGGYDLLIKPLSAYATHVDNMLHGRKREIDLPFTSLSRDISLVDGVRYYAMSASAFDEKGKPYERLFYFDAEKDFPAFQPGEMLHIVFHDKEIASITRA